MGFYHLKRRLWHLLTSRHWKGHGVHSPAVYNMVRSFSGNKNDYSVVFNIIGTRRKELLSRKEWIEVEDFGTGSRGKISRARRIDSIARRESVSLKYGGILSALARNYTGGHIVELGSSLGLGTAYLSLGNKGTRVISIEGCSVLALMAGETLRATGAVNGEIRTGMFNDLLVGIIKETGGEALFYIDGEHFFDETVANFNTIAESTNDNSMVIVAGINLNPGMRRAWTEIMKNERSVVSIELSQMGIILFDRSITPGYFKVRL